MSAFVRFVDGWKTVLGYILLSIPGIGAAPMLKTAIEGLLANPGNKQAIIDLTLQVILALGVGDRIRKNLTKVTVK